SGKNGRKNKTQRFYASAETSLKQRSPDLHWRKTLVTNWPRTNLRIALISWTRAWEASTPSPPHCAAANRGTFGGTDLRTEGYINSRTSERFWGSSVQKHFDNK